MLRITNNDVPNKATTVAIRNCRPGTTVASSETYPLSVYSPFTSIEVFQKSRAVPPTCMQQALERNDFDGQATST